MFILDTDHISLFQRHQPEVAAQILATDPLELSTTIITVEEQLRGRLNRIRQAKQDELLLSAYDNLQQMVHFFQRIRVIEFNQPAQDAFKRLRQQKIRIGTQDLRVAAIVLVQNATLVTRNHQDFAKIPDLKIADWTMP